MIKTGYTAVQRSRVIADNNFKLTGVKACYCREETDIPLRDLNRNIMWNFKNEVVIQISILK